MEEILKLISTCKTTAWWLKWLNKFHKQAEATVCSLEAAIFTEPNTQHLQEQQVLMALALDKYAQKVSVDIEPSACTQRFLKYHVLHFSWWLQMFLHFGHKNYRQIKMDSISTKLHTVSHLWESRDRAPFTVWPVESLVAQNIRMLCIRVTSLWKLFVVPFYNACVNRT